MKVRAAPPRADRIALLRERRPALRKYRIAASTTCMCSLNLGQGGMVTRGVVGSPTQEHIGARTSQDTGAWSVPLSATI